MANRDPEDWMWAQALRMLEQAERMHQQTFRPAHRASAPPSWEPPVDIVETAEQVAILVALPGVASEDLSVAIEEGGVLVVAGHGSLPVHRGQDCAVHRLEIPHGRFERRVQLPRGHFELGDRYMTNGMLVLTLTKVRSR